MRISQDLHAGIIEHALLKAPEECCGIVLCRGEQARVIIAVDNVASHPETHYAMDVAQQYDAVTTAERTGLRIGAIYHSHTVGEPYPSDMDVRRSYFPYALYLIVGELESEQPVIKAYTIRKGQVTERKLEVT